MQQETNIAIGDDSPDVYLAEVRRQCETGVTRYGGIVNHDDLVANFAENAMPVDLLSGEFETYDDFLAARRILMSQKIRRYYESL